MLTVSQFFQGMGVAALVTLLTSAWALVVFLATRWLLSKVMGDPKDPP